MRAPHFAEYGFYYLTKLDVRVPRFLKLPVGAFEHGDSLRLLQDSTAPITKGCRRERLHLWFHGFGV